MRRFVAFLAASLLLALTILPSTAGEILHKFSTNSIPVKATNISLGERAETSELVIKGITSSEEPARIGIRIDDAKSHNYTTRYNLSRLVTDGEFIIRLPLRGMRTPDNRLIDISAIRKLFVFDVEKTRKFKLTSVTIEQQDSLPDGVIALSFGKKDAPLFAGFERLDINDSRIDGARLEAVHRPGVDPLLASGIRGVERFTQSLENGEYRLSIWTEETSAWHRLPEILRRRMRINGQTVVDETYTPQEWNLQRYFLRRDVEASADADLWKTYGERRGGLITLPVQISDGKLHIEIAGHGLGATYISAILIEPKGTDALSIVQDARRTAFLEKWQFAKQNLDLPLDAELQIGEKSQALIALLAAPDSGTSLHFSVTSPTEFAATQIEFNWKNTTLSDVIKPTVWAAQRRLERANAIGNLFTLRNVQLRSELEEFPLKANIPRRFAIWLATTKNAPAGQHHGTVKIISDDTTTSFPIVLHIPDVTLKKPTRAAGFYLTHPAHLSWHKDLAQDQHRQIKCDLAFLKRFNITGNAPALAVPFAKRKDFIRETQAALQNANAQPWLAYSSAFNLYHFHGIEKGAKALGDTEKTLRALKLPTPTWSMADEPSNPTMGVGNMVKWIKTARKYAPEADFAGHLNHHDDQKYLKHFNTVLINDGFGINVDEVANIKTRNISPWLYNTGRPRLTAGAWLWRTKADRYLQWHGRLPLGDPFDPTDGREGDIQMLLPMPSVCAAQPDIHINLLEMADGLVDQQWFNWLDEQTDPRAESVKKLVLDGFGNDWESIKDTNRLHLKALRFAIGTLAQSLNSRTHD